MAANKLNPTYDATATAAVTYETSIASTTVVARHQVVAAGTLVLDLSNIQINAGEAFTIRTASGTATVIINLKWRER